ncbi:MAG TPA: helix-turn-helix domain-containing protein [Candidatus Thermoplasmatota archaeon]|nr:helix-turn-helix domain-containing protein [Candidatus Thermoplasmatota archaeon]
MDAATRVAAELGALVAGTRRDLGLAQQELAALVGVDRQYLSEIERGKVTNHLARLVRILDAVGLALTAVPRTSALGVDDSRGDAR